MRLSNKWDIKNKILKRNLIKINKFFKISKPILITINSYF